MENSCTHADVKQDLPSQTVANVTYAPPDFLVKVFFSCAGLHIALAYI